MSDCVSTHEHASVIAAAACRDDVTCAVVEGYAVFKASVISAVSPSASGSLVHSIIHMRLVDPLTRFASMNTGHCC